MVVKFEGKDLQIPEALALVSETNGKGLGMRYDYDNNQYTIDRVNYDEGYHQLGVNDGEYLDAFLALVEKEGEVEKEYVDDLRTVMGECKFDFKSNSLPIAYLAWLTDSGESVYLVSNYAKKTLQLWV